ncbi:MAG: ammonium transporter, partial [Alphaproteobacteria bacterium]|nr:ammonium transporter [Alphaproteobacteria bacterium]
VMLGARLGRYGPSGRAFPPSSIPWLALGSWLLCIGWFGFNVVSAQSLEGVSGLVAVNSLMAMVGGILAALFVGKSDPGFVHNGALAGLVAVCAGSDVFHPVGALATGAVAGALFVYFFVQCQEKWQIDDVLGVWPLHGLAGAWGGIACGIFGQEMFGGLGGVSLISQIIGTFVGCGFAAICGLIVYGGLKQIIGIRMEEEDEQRGADLAIHKIAANPETGLSG